MNCTEEIKKFKGLLDAGIITEEDFEKKKAELLAGDDCQESEAVEIGEQSEEPQEKPTNKVTPKKIVIGVVIIAILAIAFFAGQKIVEKNQQSKRAEALEMAIEPIMHDHGIYFYHVYYIDHRYEIFADGFEDRTFAQALKLLKELNSVSIDDPCGDRTISFGLATVHPGLDTEYYADYYYWCVPTYLAGDHIYETPGIYCSLYENGRTCVYECDN